MELKLMTEKDIITCTNLFIEIFNAEPWNDEWTFSKAKQYISDYFNTLGFLGAFAVDNDEVIGFIYGVRKAWWSGNEFYINEMGVKSSHRNKGVGSFLLKELKEELADADISNFALLTDRGTPAESFYQKNGFKEIERLVFYCLNF